MRRLPEEAPVTGVKPLVAWLTDVLQTLPSSTLDVATGVWLS
jgi:hypothetical protein